MVMNEFLENRLTGKLGLESSNFDTIRAFVFALSKELGGLKLLEAMSPLAPGMAIHRARKGA